MNCVLMQKPRNAVYGPDFGKYDPITGWYCGDDTVTTTTQKNMDTPVERERQRASLAEVGQFAESSLTGVASLVSAFRQPTQQQLMEQQQQMFGMQQQQPFFGGQQQQPFFGGQQNFGQQPRRNNTGVIILGVVIVGIIIAAIVMTKKG